MDPGIWEKNPENIVLYDYVKVMKVHRIIYYSRASPFKNHACQTRNSKSVTARELDDRENADSVLEFSVTTSHLYLAAVYCLVHWSI